MLATQRAAGPTVVVEAGQSLGPPRDEAVPGGEEQRRIKARLVAQTWEAGGLDALALGGNDWALGAPFVRELVAQHHLPLLAANLTCGGAAPYPASKVLEVAGRRIGVVGVTEGAVEGCEVGPMVPAIRAAVEAMGPVDLVLGLIPVETDRGLAAAISEPIPVHVVIDARGRSAQGGAEARGDTYFVGAGSEMHSVSELHLVFHSGASGWVAEGEAERVAKKLDNARARVEQLDARLPTEPEEARAALQRQRDAYAAQLDELTARATAVESARGVHRFRLSEVELDDAIADDPGVAAAVVEAKAAITAAAGGVGAAAFVPRTVTDPDSAYAGGESCAGCHPQQHAQWSTTAHARAWSTLVAQDRAMDDQCWKCHVTGADRDGGPVDAPSSGPWRDVQCEVCHGPGRVHSVVRAAGPREAGAPPDILRDPPRELCVQCHDGKQDDGRFDFTTYRPQVAH